MAQSFEVHNDGLRERRADISQSFIDSIVRLKEASTGVELTELLIFLEDNVCFAEPIASEEGWGIRRHDENRVTSVGFCILLPEDAKLHDFFEDRIHLGPTFNETTATIIMPPTTHDLTDTVKALLLVHEGKHGHEFYERQATGAEQTEEEHWLEELRAYRLEIEALRTFNPTTFDALLAQAITYLRASSRIGETKSDGYELHWEIPLPFEFSHLFQGANPGNYDKGVASTLLLISAVEKILKGLYADPNDLDRELAVFIQYLYKKEEIPSE